MDVVTKWQENPTEKQEKLRLFLKLTTDMALHSRSYYWALIALARLEEALQVTRDLSAQAPVLWLRVRPHPLDELLKIKANEMLEEVLPYELRTLQSLFKQPDKLLEIVAQNAPMNVPITKTQMRLVWALLQQHRTFNELYYYGMNPTRTPEFKPQDFILNPVGHFLIVNLAKQRPELTNQLSQHLTAVQDKIKDLDR